MERGSNAIDYFNTVGAAHIWLMHIMMLWSSNSMRDFVSPALTSFPHMSLWGMDTFMAALKETG